MRSEKSSGSYEMGVVILKRVKITVRINASYVHIRMRDLLHSVHYAMCIRLLTIACGNPVLRTVLHFVSYIKKLERKRYLASNLIIGRFFFNVCG